MLQAYPETGEAPIWIDLQDPTPEEIAKVEARFHLHVPPREALAEIEASSRLRMEGGWLFMSAPLFVRGREDFLASAPTGFVLGEKVCLTVRFAASAAFDTVRKSLEDGEASSAGDVFARLLEEVVDRAADHLEAYSEDVDKASHAIFRPDRETAETRRKLTRDTNALRRVMSDIGRASERMGKVRYTLVCIARMAQFVTDRGKDWIVPPLHDRLGGVRADIASLEQYEEHLLSRIQLLQDAATAFISIEQNDVVKVLTIASVVGVPPVMVVGLYGMNFKYMPELGWRYGYPYALALIVITTLIPLAWFKWKDWM